MTVVSSIPMVAHEATASPEAQEAQEAGCEPNFGRLDHFWQLHIGEDVVHEPQGLVACGL